MGIRTKLCSMGANLSREDLKLFGQVTTTGVNYIAPYGTYMYIIKADGTEHFFGTVGTTGFTWTEFSSGWNNNLLPSGMSIDNLGINCNFDIVSNTLSFSSNNISLQGTIIRFYGAWARVSFSPGALSVDVILTQI